MFFLLGDFMRARETTGFFVWIPAFQVPDQGSGSPSPIGGGVGIAKEAPIIYYKYGLFPGWFCLVDLQTSWCPRGAEICSAGWGAGEGQGSRHIALQAPWGPYGPPFI